MDRQQLNQGNGAIIVIDGECALCQHITKFLIRYDHQQLFSFVTLQSEAGKYLLQQYQLPASYEDSFLFIDFKRKRMRMRSAAALSICRKLGGWWSLLYPLIIVPPFIRDAVYRLIAKYRHRFFANADHCLLPTPEIKNRFIETKQQLEHIQSS
ncbi:thiol-disulfide oxidoreductase DCC family protein [Paenibacillus yanchengensis]|uniref:Thiol-disulfide oxidoreductase DCC family protein n=1 Tax=Paenibacillus yanchengensis TaxID=2035833 RepID=A0ABW4YIW0_9BACL